MSPAGIPIPGGERPPLSPDHKIRIAVLGVTGMLGSSVYKTLKDKCELVITARSQEKFDLLEKVYGGTADHTKILFDAIHWKEHGVNDIRVLTDQIGDVDLVINCIGILNKFPDGVIPPPREYYWINTELPVELSEIYRGKLIQPSTDCVFDGTDAPYSEDSPYKPSYGFYGYAKAFGDELVTRKSSLVLRCCLIGEELSPDAFQMFSWFKRQKTASGYTNCIITPITGIEFANVCWRILTENLPWTGLLHIATEPISKYEILKKYKEVKGLNIELLRDPSVKINKSLITNFSRAYKTLEVASFNQMMCDL